MQNTQNPQNEGQKGLVEDIEYFEHRGTNLKICLLEPLAYKLVGAYKIRTLVGDTFLEKHLENLLRRFEEKEDFYITHDIHAHLEHF